MGSLQQSILGVFCIATAFLLGQYVRTHPSPDQLEQDRIQQASVSPSPSFGFSAREPSVTTMAKPQLPAPSAGFGSTETASVAKPVAKPVANFIAPIERTVEVERKIDIPDFSQLAASFNNTPLALPGTPMSARTTAVPVPKLNTGSFYVRPAPEPTVAAANFESTNSSGQSAYAGSRPEPVSPPQPMEVYEMSERPTSFRREDFQPQLIAKATSRRTTPAIPESSLTRPESGRKRISLAPPESNDNFMTPEIPDLEVILPKEPATFRETSVGKNRAANQIHSYYDVGTADASSSVLGRKDFKRPEKVATTRRIPFGLNDQGRKELTRIQSRQQTNDIDLPTDRFSLHTTKPGDTLQSLSSEYYGKPEFYLDIYLANQQLLRNPAAIPAGIQLRIPQYDQ